MDILKPIILNTANYSSMKLNCLFVEHHKFIMGLIVFNIYIQCAPPVRTTG